MSLAIIKSHNKLFERLPREKWTLLAEKTSKIKDKEIQVDLIRNNRYIIDVEEELVNVTFYNKLESDKNL